MTRLLSILLLSCLPALGQMTTVIPKDWTGLHGLVTNQTGYPLLAWYKASDYTTNAGVATLPDSWTNSWHLTNVTTAAFPTSVPNDLNGYTTIQFDGSNDYLNTVLYTNVQPSEVIMIFCDNDDTPGLTKYFAGYWYASIEQMLSKGTVTVAPYAGSYMAAQVNMSNYYNTWLTFDLVYSGTSSVLFTNSITCRIEDTGTQAGHGFVVGMDYDNNQWTKFKLAELIAFGNGSPTPGTNAVARSNIWYYINQKYAR